MLRWQIDGSGESSFAATETSSGLGHICPGRNLYFTMKALPGSHEAARACTQRLMDIGQPSRYEEGGRRPDSEYLRQMAQPSGFHSFELPGSHETAEGPVFS